MYESQTKSEEHRDPLHFQAHIRAVNNGFILSVNGHDYVIQGVGDKQTDFDSLINALEVAYQKAAY